MLRAYKYRIYPTVQQQKVIEQTFAACRLVYNLGLEIKKYAWQTQRKNISSIDLCYQLVDIKKDYIWLSEVDSQSLQASVKRLDKAFENFYRGNGFPKYKSKRNKQSFQCPNNTRKIDWENSTLSIPKIKDLPIVLSRNFEGQIKTVTISRTPSDKYFASILVMTDEILPSKPAVSSDKTIGIDLGIKSFVVSSDGQVFEANRKLKNNLQRLKVLSKRISRKKKGSNNRKKAVKCLAILHERITNQRTDYIHKTTSSLVKGDNQTFVIEDLNVAGMLKNRKLSQAISDVSFGEFSRQMQYKCEWYGKNLIKIGTFEPSSKTCSDCGTINETLTLADRKWVCANCGSIHDRDFNAAKNIRQMGLNKYSGAGSSGEPVEKRRLRRSKKQENILV